MNHQWIAVLALAAVLSGLAPTRADVIMEGTKSIPNAITVDFGELRPFVFDWYLVQPDDTLTAIAKAAFGDGSRWHDIADANPGIEADRIRPGDRLLIPPAEPIRNTQKDVVARGWHAFAWSGWYGSAPVRIGHGQQIDRAYHSIRIILVRDDVLGELDGSSPVVTQLPADVNARFHRDAERPDWFAKGVRHATLPNRKIVDESSPAARRSTRCVLERITADEIEVREVIRDFDATGSLLTAGDVQQAATRRRTAQLGLGAIGLALALLIGLRRSRSA